MVIFEINFAVEPKENFPCDKIKNSERYTVICKDGVVKQIIIKGIESDDSKTAITMGENELRALMGLLALNLGMILDYRGGRSISIVDGRERIHQGVRSNAVTVHVLPAPIATDLSQLETVRNPSFERSLSLYYLASYLENHEDVPEAFLTMFLTLETLVEENELDKSYKRYKYIRHGLVHTKLDDANTRHFLRDEFLSETPDWQDASVRLRLRNWYGNLSSNVTLLLRKELK